jgi:chromosome segregation ATPase
VPTDDEAARLGEQLLAAHEQLVQRDEAFRAWDHEVAELRTQLDSAKRQIEELQSTLDAMRATRAWRLAERWWAIRGRLGRRASS